MEQFISDAQFVVGPGVVDPGGVKVKHLGLFVDVFRDRQRFMKSDHSIVNNVECKCTCTVKMMTGRCKEKGL